VNEIEEERSPIVSAAQRRNRLLIEDPDDAFVGNRGGMGAGAPSFAAPRNLDPLLIDNDDMAMSLGMPKLEEMARAKKHSQARGLFNTFMHSKRAANPWTKTGQQTEASVQDMFGEATPRVQGFGKLFGRKPGNFEAKARAEHRALDKEAGVGFFGRLKRAIRGNPDGPKRTWMDRLFGARKKAKETSPDEQAAFRAQRLGPARNNGVSWADALAPLNADGSAKWEGEQEDADEKAPIADLKSQEPVSESIEEEEKQPAPQPQRQPQPQLIEDDQTVDDNSVDSDDDYDRNDPSRLIMQQFLMEQMGKKYRQPN